MKGERLMPDKKEEAPRYREDVSALREKIGNAGNLTGTQTVMLFMVALVISVGLGWLLLRDDGPDSIPILSTPFTAEALGEEEMWKLVATEQALLAYLEASGEIRIERLDTPAQSSAPSPAKWLMSGRLQRSEGDNDGLILRVELQSLTNEYITFAADIPGVTESLSDMAQRAAGQVFSWSGKDLLTPPQMLLAEAELPVSNDALQYLSEGRAAYARRNDRQAITAFQEALMLSRNHPVIQNELSHAWLRLGYNKRAQEAAAQAYETRDQLTRQRQLEIEAHYHMMNSHWAEAQDAYSALKAFHPHALDYWLGLVDACLKGADMDKAEQTIMAMRELPAPLGSDPRIDLVEASFWYQKGTYDKGSASAVRAIEKARLSADDALLGDALLKAVNFVDVNNAEYLAEAETIFTAQDNSTKLAEVYGEMGKLKRISGALAEAETLYLKAIELAASVGDEANIADLQNGLAIVYDHLGRLESSLALKRDLAAYFRDRDIMNRYGIMLENIGISLFKLGRLAEAEASFDEALAVFREVDDTIGIAWAPYHRSRIRSRAGDLDEAERLARQALANAAANPEGDLKGNSLFEIAHIAFFRGDFETSRRVFTEARAGYAEYDNTISVAEADLMLARIALRTGALALAEEHLELARAMFDSDNLPNYQLDARTVEIDLAFARNTLELETLCTDLARRIGGLEFREFVLRARTRVERCRAASSPQPVDESAFAEIIGSGLFEAALSANTMLAWIYDDRQLTEEKARAVEAARALADERGYSLTGLLPA